MRIVLLAFLFGSIGTLTGPASALGQSKDSVSYVPVLEFGKALLDNGDFDLAGKAFYDVWRSKAPDSLRALAAYRVKTSADSLAAQFTRRVFAFMNVRYRSTTSEPWGSRWSRVIYGALWDWVDEQPLDSLGIRIWFDNYNDYAHVNAEQLYEWVWTELRETYWGQRMRVESVFDEDTYPCDMGTGLTAMEDFLDAVPNSSLRWDAHYRLGILAGQIWSNGGDTGVEGQENTYSKPEDLESLRQVAIEHLTLAQDHQDDMVMYRDSKSLSQTVARLQNSEMISVRSCD